MFPDIGGNILPDLPKPVDTLFLYRWAMLAMPIMASITATRVESQMMDFLRMLSRFHFPRTFIEAPPFPSLAQRLQKLPAEL